MKRINRSLRNNNFFKNIKLQKVRFDSNAKADFLLLLLSAITPKSINKVHSSKYVRQYLAQVLQ